MADLSSADLSPAKLAASVLGAFVSLKFVQGTLAERGMMFIGGAALSYYSTGPLVAWIGGAGLDGLVGFFSGLLGMTIVSKLYEIIQLMDAKQIGADIWAWVVRKWGA